MRFLYAIAAILLFTFAFSAEETIHITNGEWEPYLSEYSYEYGLASHIVSLAFKSQGITVQWGFFPWKRSYEVAKVCKAWQASAVWWPTDEAKADFYVSDPVVNTSFVLFHLKDHELQWLSLHDLKGLRIGVTRGYDYGVEFMAAVKSGALVVETADSDEQNFKKLLAGRLDVFPNDPLVGQSQIRNTFSPKDAKMITYHPREFNKDTLNLIISKKCENGRFLLDKFNNGLRLLVKSGEIAKMFEGLNAGKYDKHAPKPNE